MKKLLQSTASLPYLFIAFGILCLPPFALATVACFTELDVLYGFYRPASFFGAAAWIAFGFGLLIALCAFFAAKELKVGALRFVTPMTYLPAGLCCAASLLFALYAFADGFPMLKVMRPLPILCGLFALGMAVFFLLYIVNPKQLSSLRAGTGLCGALSLCLYAMLLYFDTVKALNATTEVATEFAFLACAVFLLFEVRIAIGRQIWKLYYAVGFIAAFLSGFVSIPALIYYIATGKLALDSVFALALLLCFFAFILCRMITVARSVRREEEVIASALREAAIVPEKIAENKDNLSKKPTTIEETEIDAGATDNEILENQLGLADLMNEEGNSENGDKTNAE